ncbi:MAG: hypothetical protein EOO71_32575 [Myxococcaceae bacterium]|nr:MAG: hypothetical protein EOO71_32575 [Myxococcaceae bacterium]
MSQQWIWMGLAAGTLALGPACSATESPVLLAQVDPNSAGAITTGQPNPGAPAGTVEATPESAIGVPSPQDFGNTGSGQNTAGTGTGTGGSGSGAVLPQPYTAPTPITGAPQDNVTGSGAVIPPDTGSTPAPGMGSSVSGSGVVLPPDTGSAAAPGAGNTVSGSGAVLPPSTGTTAPGAGTTLSPDTNTSSNSVTPLGGGTVPDPNTNTGR